VEHKKRDDKPTGLVPGCGGAPSLETGQVLSILFLVVFFCGTVIALRASDHDGG
jgi:hypothetical protein